MESPRRKVLIAFAALFVTLLAAYSNHFENGFHFDDPHAVVNNPAIRKLANIPRFFNDARTFSVDPTSQSYRPLVTVSLALDYWLGGGLKPFWFHVSTFLWFVVQIVLMYALYMYVLQRTCPDSQNVWIAWFAAAIYALHPASAETVNYIIQRGDLYVALGIVAGLVIYAWKPTWRRYGLYFLPPLAAMFAKPPAIVFALFLLAYILLIDRGRALASVPAFVLGAAFLLLEKVMTPPHFFHTTIRSLDYWITQPYVTWRYFRTFFVPSHLNVDTDLPAFHSLGNPLVWAGILFCALLIGAAVVTARRTEWRAVSFGLWWFLIGLIPTAIYPLNEVENDHRMFLPFIGLSLAVVGTVALLLRRHASASRQRFATAAGLALLAAFAWGTHGRNEVWHTEETLWRDAIEKSPNNSRAHFTLAIALSEIEGRLPEAISEYQAALRIKPDYTEGHNNLAVALSAFPGRLPEAISEYETALRINPDSAELHNNFGAILATQPGRLPDAVSHYQAALRIKPDFLEAHYNLGSALARIPGRLPEAATQFEAVAQIQPDFKNVEFNLADVLSKIPGRLPDAISHYEAALRINPAFAEAHNNLGNALSRIPDRMPEAISHYEAAIRIRPGFMEAHYNLGILLANIPGRSQDAVAQLEAAQRLQPDPAIQRLVAQLRARY